MASPAARRAAEVLDTVVERLAFREQLRAYGVWNIWAEVVGDVLARKAEPLRIDGGKLFIRVTHSTWMQELQFLKEEIRQRLNQRLGGDLVHELFFIQGRVTRRKRERPPAPYPVDERAIAAAVPDLGKPTLEEALRRLVRARARRLGPAAS